MQTKGGWCAVKLQENLKHSTRFFMGREILRDVFTVFHLTDDELCKFRANDMLVVEEIQKNKPLKVGG